MPDAFISEGRQIFTQRKIDVEPVFGQIKGLFGLQEMESEREASSEN